MKGKLILTGLKERLKVYAGIVLFYLLYAVLSAVSEPTPRMDNILDWFTWNYEVFGVKIYAMTFILLGMAAVALLVADIIFFARDIYSIGNKYSRNIFCDDSASKGFSDLLADIISNDGILGLYQGRAETGPRALGYRSILTNPCNPRWWFTLGLSEQAAGQCPVGTACFSPPFSPYPAGTRI